MVFSYKKIVELDCKFMLWIARHRRPPFILFFKLMTYSAVGRVWFILGLILSLANQFGYQLIENQSVFLRALFAPLMAWIIGQFIKKHFKRERPFQCIPDYTSLVRAPQNDSFPSLHASSTASFFIALLLLHHPWAYGVGVWALLASFSRLYLGVHFLSDVLSGVLLGVLCGCLIAIN